MSVTTRCVRFWAVARTVLVSALALGIAPAVVPTAEASPPIDFNTEIKPILSDKCFHCHGPDAAERKSGLRLDTPEGAFGEAASGGRAVVPGDLEESELYWRITSDHELDQMPPPRSGRTLTEAEIERLTRWIEQGAPWEAHWSFVPLSDVPIPEVRDEAWPQNPIDRFILARLDAEGLTPVPEASRERILRRLSFDLTGLPPMPEEIDAFLNDDRPDAYDRLVDRLLASPRFGERMAVDWLDLARYADTFGYQADVYRPTWPWRDWVIAAFNANLPYDQFLTWQLAGDLLPDATPEQLLATAFNRHHRQTNEGGSIEEEFRAEYVADRTNTFGAAFLGLTMECARCHDHKYDPISQNEYYQLFAFFNNIDESGLYSHFTDAIPTPTLLLADEPRQQQIQATERRIAEAEADLARFAESRRPAFDAWLAEVPGEPSIQGLIGDFPLDVVADGQTENRADPEAPARLADDPEPVPGRVGQALRLSGENNVTLPMGNFTRNDPFALALWILTPDHKERAVVIHRSRAWTDAGSRGYQLLIEDGRLSAALVHFWPGNAIGIQTVEPIPTGEWVHVVMSYDGSSRAEGLRLYVNGQPTACETVRDHLYKDITGGGGDKLVIGQRFRDRGFKHGLVDEVQVFERRLTLLEAAELHQPGTLARALEQLAAERDDALRDALFAYYLGNHDEAYQARLDELRRLRQKRGEAIDPVAEIMVMKEMAERRPTFLLERGAYDAPGERVEPGTPESVLPMAEDLPRNRLGLARWLTAPENPLTARVAVNRVWQAFFGRGLVATADDFGSQGERPSHPELLDWLAQHFIDSGWDLKQLCHLIVTSATYRQDSTASPELLARDPENVLLARGPRYRLPAEMIRDNALAASGLLVPTLGGPPVKPYQPEGLWEEKSGLAYQRDEGEGSHRRSLYTFWKRTSPPPAMILLDAPDREVCVPQRQATATPLQALLFWNDPQYVEAARVLAERAINQNGSDLPGRIAFVFRSLTSRLPSAQEADVLKRLYDEQYEEFRSGPGDAEALLAIGDAPRDPALDPAEHAALTVLAQALLSYDETVTKR